MIGARIRTWSSRITIAESACVLRLIDLFNTFRTKRVDSPLAAPPVIGVIQVGRVPRLGSSTAPLPRSLKKRSRRYIEAKQKSAVKIVVSTAARHTKTAHPPTVDGWPPIPSQSNSNVRQKNPTVVKMTNRTLRTRRRVRTFGCALPVE